MKGLIYTSSATVDTVITRCRTPLTIQVKLTDGYDGPDTQLVLNVSPNATIRLLSGDGIP